MSTDTFKIHEYGNGNEIEVIHYTGSDFFEILIGEDTDGPFFEGIHMTHHQMCEFATKINKMLGK